MDSKRMNRRPIAWFLVLLLFVAACGRKQPDPTPTLIPATPLPAATEKVEELVVSQPIARWEEVADRLWVLVGYGDALNPTVVKEGTIVTALFSSTNSQVSGSGGCNNYFANYTADQEGSLTITGPSGATMMACETDIADQESTYFKALEAVTGYAVTAEGRLETAYDTGQPYEEKLVFALGEIPLGDTTWRLVSYGDADDPQELGEGTAITALFSPGSDTTGTVSGNATCNSYTASYTVDGEEISFGVVAGTRMMCSVGADQEAAYLAALETASSYHIAGAILQITYEDGVLNYTSLDLPLERVLWRAGMVLGQEVPEGTEIIALFGPGEEDEPSTIGGSAGCNSYSAPYEAEDDQLSIVGPIATTMAICPDEALAQLESAYLTALEKSKGYEIAGDQMVMYTEDGDIQFAADRQPLEGTLWALVALGDIEDPQPPVEGSSFTAQFSRLPSQPSGTVEGTTGCNEYNATYTANLGEIKINLPAKTQNEDCPWGSGNYEVEQQFFLALNTATEYRILSDLLQIPYGDPPDQVLVFVATPPPVGEAAMDLTPLHNTFWYLSALGQTRVLPGTEVTAGFAINEDGVTGAMRGSGGCNAYQTSIGENFAIGPVASTRRACETAVMDQENAFLAWLGTAYRYDRAGDQLLISTAKGVLVFNSSPILDQAHELQGVTWYLSSYEQSSPVQGSNPTAFFAKDGRSLNGNTGCNDYSGEFEAVQGNGLTVSGFSSTRVACASNELAAQEQAFLRLLPAAIRYSVSGRQLQVVTADGGALNFSAIPPEPVGPTAIIVAPGVGETGKPLTFDGYQSQAGSAPIVSYEWDMGDGTRFYGPVYEYAYGTAGTYDVKLTVLDEATLRNTATHVVQINPVVEVVPPTAAIEGPPTVSVGEPVTFSATGSQQGTNPIAGYQWRSGDGNDTTPVPEDSFTTIYAKPGTYYPSVTVVDVSNLSDSAGTAIVVNATLEGTNWALQNAIAGTSITLQFVNGRLTGFAGCNTYNAGYTTTLAAGGTNDITVAPIAATGQVCSQEIMNQEQAYLESLEAATSYAIEGATLTLATVNGPLVFDAALPTAYTAP